MKVSFENNLDWNGDDDHDDDDDGDDDDDDDDENNINENQLPGVALIENGSKCFQKDLSGMNEAVKRK